MASSSCSVSMLLIASSTCIPSLTITCPIGQINSYSKQMNSTVCRHFLFRFRIAEHWQANRWVFEADWSYPIWFFVDFPYWKTFIATFSTFPYDNWLTQRLAFIFAHFSWPAKSFSTFLKLTFLCSLLADLAFDTPQRWFFSCFGTSQQPPSGSGPFVGTFLLRSWND